MSDVVVVGIIVLNILAAALAWYVAEQKGRDGSSWFFLSLILTPILTLLALIALPVGKGKPNS